MLRITFRAADTVIHRLTWNLEYPHIVGVFIAKAVGGIPLFDDEVPRRAIQAAPMLGKEHLGAKRNGDQKRGMVILGDLRLAAGVFGLVGTQPRQRESLPSAFQTFREP